MNFFAFTLTIVLYLFKIDLFTLFCIFILIFYLYLSVDLYFYAKNFNQEVYNEDRANKPKKESKLQASLIPQLHQLKKLQLMNWKTQFQISLFPNQTERKQLASDCL